MLSTPMATNTAETMSMDKEPEKASTSMPTVTATTELLSATRSMESEGSPPKTKDSTMVYLNLFRTMGKRSQTWRRHLHIRQQGLLLRMVAVWQEERHRDLHLQLDRNQIDRRVVRKPNRKGEVDLPQWNLLLGFIQQQQTQRRRSLALPQWQ